MPEGELRKIVKEELLDLIRYNGEVRGEIGKIILEVIGKTLKMILEDVEELKKTVNENTREIKEIKAELKRHSEDIREIKAELRKHSQILEEHTREIKEIKAELKRHSQILEEHTREIKEIKAELRKHSQILEEHTKEIREIKAELKRHSELLEEQNKFLRKIASYLEGVVGMGVEEDIRLIAEAVLENLGYEVKRYRTKSGYDVDILVKDSVVKMIEVKRTFRNRDLTKLWAVWNEIKEEFKDKKVLKPLVIAYQKELTKEGIEKALSWGVAIITVEDIWRTPWLNKKARLLEERIKEKLEE